MKKPKSINLRYFLLAICLTASLMLIKKSNFLESLSNSINLRSLKPVKKITYATKQVQDWPTNIRPISTKKMLVEKN